MAKPSVSEVIPSESSCSGGLRVAILGQNFVQSSTMNAKFEDTFASNVEYHESRTILAVVPKRSQPKDVIVYATNNGINFGESTARFKFLPK